MDTLHPDQKPCALTLTAPPLRPPDWPEVLMDLRQVYHRSRGSLEACPDAMRAFGQIYGLMVTNNFATSPPAMRAELAHVLLYDAGLGTQSREALLHTHRRIFPTKWPLKDK